MPSTKNSIADANRYQGSGRFGRCKRMPATAAPSAAKVKRGRRVSCVFGDGIKKYATVARMPTTKNTSQACARLSVLPLILISVSERAVCDTASEERNCVTYFLPLGGAAASSGETRGCASPPRGGFAFFQDYRHYNHDRRFKYMPPGQKYFAKVGW